MVNKIIFNVKPKVICNKLYIKSDQKLGLASIESKETSLDNIYDIWNAYTN